MATDKELADAYRAVLNDGRVAGDRVWMRQRINELDPEPKYADGTIALIRFGGEGPVVVARMVDGKWDDNLTLSKPNERDEVEPLRVLGDDEIAVKRAAYLDDWGISQTRLYGGELRSCGNACHLAAAQLVENYADALEAEAGER